MTGFGDVGEQFAIWRSGMVFLQARWYCLQCL